MNMAGVNPAAAGGPVGGGMMMMNNGSPATQPMPEQSLDNMKVHLNTYIYDYFLKIGMHDVARTLANQPDKFKVRFASKQSPGRRKDEINGVDSDAMDVDSKSDIPDDIPRPQCPDATPGGGGFLLEWFSIFSDIFAAARTPKQNNMGPAAQYLMHTQNMQRMRENSQNPNMMRSGGMMNANQFNAMRANMRSGMVNGAVQGGDLKNRITPQQMQMMAAQKQQQMQQMQRDQGDDVNGRPGTPADGENGGSPSKRPRLDNPQFNNAMMPNGRPMPGVAPQNMMIQNAFNPNMNQAHLRQNGGMPQKPMQPGMANGMMNMNNAGSPMMPGLGQNQFGQDMSMEMYNAGRMAGQPTMPNGPAAQSGNHALQDYQMQLMLLEQQNKKRLMMARQEQDNAVNRDGAPLPGGMGAAGMSPAGSRTGTSPNPTDQMKRNAQMGMPGSPAAGENLQGRSPAGMNFMNGMPGGDFNPANMFMGDKQGMGQPGPNMRPPTSMDMNMGRQQGRMAGQFPGGQPMAQQPSQGGQQPMGTPGQRNEMPPPQAPAGGSAQRNQPSSPAQSGNAPPTPSQSNKPNPKGKKGKDDTGAGNTAGNKTKKQTKKGSTANNAEQNEPPATPTPATPITPHNPQSFQQKGQAPSMANANAPPAAVQQMPPNQQQMQQQDLATSFPDFGNDQGSGFNLDFSTLDNADVLENFDFDSFLNTTTDDAFNFDNSIVGNDLTFDAGAE